jgi:hypothetical protein
MAYINGGNTGWDATESRYNGFALVNLITDVTVADQGGLWLGWTLNPELFGSGDGGTGEGEPVTGFGYSHSG